MQSAEEKAQGCTLSAPAQSPSAASAWRGCARAPPATHRKGRLAVAGSWAAQTLARKPSVRPDHSPFSALSLTCVCPPLPSPPASDASDHAVRRPLPSTSQQQAQPHLHQPGPGLSEAQPLHLRAWARRRLKAWQEQCPRQGAEHSRMPQSHMCERRTAWSPCHIGG